MFNDGWIKSPAFVDWNAMGYCISFQSIMNFLQEIVEPQTRVDILAYLIKSAELIYGKWGKKELTPILKDLLETQKAASKVRKQELARQAAEERAKNTPRKEKPEYVLSVEEIIQYVCEEDVDARQVVSRMLRYFADEKKGWNIKAIKALMEPMKTQQVIFNAPVGQVNNNVEHQKNSLK